MKTKTLHLRRVFPRNSFALMIRRFHEIKEIYFTRIPLRIESQPHCYSLFLKISKCENDVKIYTRNKKLLMITNEHRITFYSTSTTINTILHNHLFSIKNIYSCRFGKFIFSPLFPISKVVYRLDEFCEGNDLNNLFGYFNELIRRD
jgi:hypothetical protein